MPRYIIKRVVLAILTLVVAALVPAACGDAAAGPNARGALELTPKLRVTIEDSTKYTDSDKNPLKELLAAGYSIESVTYKRKANEFDELNLTCAQPDKPSGRICEKGPRTATLGFRDGIQTDKGARYIQFDPSKYVLLNGVTGETSGYVCRGEFYGFKAKALPQLATEVPKQVTNETAMNAEGRVTLGSSTFVCTNLELETPRRR